MAKHPYLAQPDTSFWSRAVAQGWDARSTVATSGPLLRQSDAIVSAGSCFAANIIPHLEAAGFTYLRTEEPLSLDGDGAPDRFGYGRYSAAYGNIYTARQLLQLLRRSRGRFAPQEDCWAVDDVFVDPYRPGLPYPAESREEFDLLTADHLAKVREAFERASVFIFTLGLTESWESAADGAVFPVCPGTIAGTFDAARHRFRNFSVAEVTEDLSLFVTELAEFNPACRVILTVSPVPLVATATTSHVLTASIHSKSVLRVTCSEIAERFANVTYFPAYELITGPQSPGYFEADRRNVSQAGIDMVMDVLLFHSEAGEARPHAPAPKDEAAALSQALAKAECEESMLDRR